LQCNNDVIDVTQYGLHTLVMIHLDDVHWFGVQHVIKQRGNIGFWMKEGKTEEDGNTGCTCTSAKVLESAVLS
jgi:hypothetical protein